MTAAALNQNKNRIEISVGVYMPRILFSARSSSSSKSRLANEVDEVEETTKK